MHIPITTVPQVSGVGHAELKVRPLQAVET